MKQLQQEVTHRMNPYQTRKFKELQSDWYKKLEESGFEDIEDVSSKEEFLKTWHSSYFQKRYEPEVFESNETYYRKARSFLEDTFQNVQYGLFEKKLDDVIWEKHAEGISLRDIAKELNLKVHQVHKVVTVLKKRMIEGR
jgi:hypothetical protein